MAEQRPEITFGKYVRQWLTAALKPAYDAFGLLGVVVGGGIWAWHKFHPESFKRIAAFLGFSQDAAMSDLVWEVPLLVGLAVFLYRIPLSNSEGAVRDTPLAT